MKQVVLLVLVLAVASTSAQCPPCNCFPVNTINVTLQELVWNSPLYSQAASIVSKGFNLDSVCLSLSNTLYNPDNVLTEQFIKFINGSTFVRSSIQSTNSTGRFFVIGLYDSFEVPLAGFCPTRSYYDSILGNPCSGTYVLYRCQVTGACVTDVNKVDVVVVSSRIRDTPQCIEAGKVIGQTAFPGLEFYDLPKTSNDLCPCRLKPVGPCAGKKGGPDIIPYESLKVFPNNLHVERH